MTTPCHHHPLPNRGHVWYPNAPINTVTATRGKPDLVTLTGHDDLGNPIRITMTTDTARDLGHATLNAANHTRSPR